MTARPKPQPPRYSDANSELLSALQEGEKKWAKTAMQSPESAREALRKMGIITAKGNLTKRYR